MSSFCFAGIVGISPLLLLKSSLNLLVIIIVVFAELEMVRAVGISPVAIEHLHHTLSSSLRVLRLDRFNFTAGANIFGLISTLENLEDVSLCLPSFSANDRSSNNTASSSLSSSPSPSSSSVSLPNKIKKLRLFFCQQDVPESIFRHLLVGLDESLGCLDLSGSTFALSGWMKYVIRLRHLKSLKWCGALKLEERRVLLDPVE